MPNQPVEGALFRRNYLRPEQKQDDSIRARRRIYRTYDEGTSYAEKFIALVGSELGLRFPYNGYHEHEKYWTTCAVHDFLDSVTLLYRVVPAKLPVLTEMRRIFSEEHLRYRIDDQGGVHYLVDEQFEQNVAAAVEGLGTPRYEAARHALEQALHGMSGPKPSGKALIRGVFEAVESAFLARIQPAPANVNILNEPNVTKYLRPILEARYAGVPEAKDKLDRVLEIHKAWVKTAHPFRHGAPLDQVHEAPFDYAVLIADQGMAFLRFIVAP